MAIVKSKKFMVAFLIVGLLATLVVGCNKGQEISKDEAIAKVNGEFISKAKFEKSLAQIKTQYEQQYNLDFSEGQAAQMLPTIKEKLLDQMIQERVLMQKALEEGIEFTEDEVAERLSEVKAQYKSEENFKKQLKEAGVSLSDVKDNIKKNLLVKRLGEKLTGDIKIDEKELKEYFENNKKQFVQAEKINASHILVKDKEKANNIKAKLDSGSDFAKLAAEYSTGPSAKKGGELGYFSKGQMVPEFEKVAFDLKVGEISDPVKTQYGYHIVKIADKKEASEPKFAEIKGKIYTGHSSQTDITEASAAAYLEAINKYLVYNKDK
jgi:foldase protein PrsA